jgi:hypothetical protein
LGPAAVNIFDLINDSFIFSGDFFDVCQFRHAITASMSKSVTLPMPVEIVLSNPVLVSASGPAFRLILSLVFVFWCGGCRALPADDAGLCALARCGASTWRKEGQAVQDALKQIIPQLQRHHALAMQRAETYRQVRVEAGQKGAAARWHKPKVPAMQNFGLNQGVPVPLRQPSKAASNRAGFAYKPIGKASGTVDVRFGDG